MWTPGQQLGRFTLDREIGQGSHGVVWLATDTALSTQVAIKILHPWLTEDVPVRDRFKRELLLARRIAHPGICRLFDLHEESGGAFFITMDYVEGETLLNILKREGRLPPDRATKILRGVCSALAAAHQAGVIHRDLKPANIIVKSGDQPMILDFGTATAGDVSRVTRPGTAVGSMRFIAPEVFTGTSPSVLTDIYSLGVVAYVAIAGRLPYNAAAGAVEMLEMIRGAAPMRLDALEPDVPARLADVVARAMHREPSARFASSAAFADALAEVEAEIASAGTSTKPPPTPTPSTGDFARWAPSQIIRDSVPHTDPGTKAQTLDERPPENAGEPFTLTGMPPTGETQEGEAPLASRDTVVTSFIGVPPAPISMPEPPPSDLTVVSLPPQENTVRVARLDIAQVETGRTKVVDRRRPVFIAAAVGGAIAIIAAAMFASGDNDALLADGGAPVLAVVDDVDAGALADAGLADAVVAAAADAGPEAADADAGPSGLAFTDEDFEDEPAEPVEDVGPTPRPRPRPDRFDAEIKSVRLLMLRRGFVPGDLPTAELQLRKAKVASRAGRSSDATAALSQARTMVEGQKIDRTFVLAKLNRFNTRFDRKKRPDIAGRVTPLASEAATSFSAGQFDVANQKLNRAFVMIGKYK